MNAYRLQAVPIRPILGRMLWVILASVVLHASHASAQHAAANYPDKPVTVVIGYPAGGPTDVLMRAIAPHLTRAWKQQVIIDNRTGANEAIAARHVARARPDGTTLLLSTEAPLTLNPFLMSKLQYDPQQDFAPISLLLKSPLALVVPTHSPANSIEEFIALAKARAQARDPLAYGSSGPGNVIHLPMAMLANQHGLEMTHVPYGGVAPLLTAIVSGQVDAAWAAVAGVVPFVGEGRMKALVVDAPTRMKTLPQAPVFRETSVTPVQADFIFALLAPAGTSLAIREKIADAFRRVMADSDFQKDYLDPFGYVTLNSSPMELEQYLAQDRIRQAERVRVSGVTMQ